MCSLCAWEDWGAKRQPPGQGATRARAQSRPPSRSSSLQGKLCIDPLTLLHIQEGRVTSEHEGQQQRLKEHVNDVERWQAGIYISWFDSLVCSRRPRCAFSRGSGRLAPPPVHASPSFSFSLLRLKTDTWLSLSATWLWLGRICENIRLL